MLFELCWQLGFAHPDELAHRLNYRQLAGWIAWLRKEPRGDRRADVRAAVQTAYLRQIHSGEQEDPTTFLPQFSETTTIEDPEVEQLVDDFLSPQPLML